MASLAKMSLVLFLASSLFLNGALAEIVCEDLPKDICAFSISSSGKRCLLENYKGGEGNMEYQCTTSEVVVERMAEYIESEECVRSCGVDRDAVGISSDSLLEPQFTAKLCAPACYQNCPNIVDLYFNLAAGEGVNLPDLCQLQRTNPHRAMAELMSSGAAPGPVSSDSADAPVSEDQLMSSKLNVDAAAPVSEDDEYISKLINDDASSPASGDDEASAPASGDDEASAPASAPASGDDEAEAPASGDDEAEAAGPDSDDESESASAPNADAPAPAPASM